MNTAERAYIAALTSRYEAVTSEHLTQIAGLCSSFSMFSGDKAKDYANEMRKLSQLFPQDADAQALYARIPF